MELCDKKSKESYKEIRSINVDSDYEDDANEDGNEGDAGEHDNEGADECGDDNGEEEEIADECGDNNRDEEGPDEFSDGMGGDDDGEECGDDDREEEEEDYEDDNDGDSSRCRPINITYYMDPLRYYMSPTPPPELADPDDMPLHEQDPLHPDQLTTSSPSRQTVIPLQQPTPLLQTTARSFLKSATFKYGQQPQYLNPPMVWPWWEYPEDDSQDQVDPMVLASLHLSQPPFQNPDKLLGWVSRNSPEQQFQHPVEPMVWASPQSGLNINRAHPIDHGQSVWNIPIERTHTREQQSQHPVEPPAWAAMNSPEQQSQHPVEPSGSSSLPSGLNVNGADPTCHGQSFQNIPISSEQQSHQVDSTVLASPQVSANIGRLHSLRTGQTHISERQPHQPDQVAGPSRNSPEHHFQHPDETRTTASSNSSELQSPHPVERIVWESSQAQLNINRPHLINQGLSLWNIPISSEQQSHQVDSTVLSSPQFSANIGRLHSMRTGQTHISEQQPHQPEQVAGPSRNSPEHHFQHPDETRTTASSHSSEQQSSHPVERIVWESSQAQLNINRPHLINQGLSLWNIPISSEQQPYQVDPTVLAPPQFSANIGRLHSLSTGQTHIIEQQPHQPYQVAGPSINSLEHHFQHPDETRTTASSNSSEQQSSHPVERIVWESSQAQLNINRPHLINQGLSLWNIPISSEQQPYQVDPTVLAPPQFSANIGRLHSLSTGQTHIIEQQPHQPYQVAGPSINSLEHHFQHPDETRTTASSNSSEQQSPHPVDPSVWESSQSQLNINRPHLINQGLSLWNIPIERAHFLEQQSQHPVEPMVMDTSQFSSHIGTQYLMLAAQHHLSEQYPQQPNQLPSSQINLASECVSNVGRQYLRWASQHQLSEQHSQQPDQLPGPSTQRNLANEYSSNIGRLNSMRVAQSHLSERRAYHPYQLPGPSTQRNLASQYSSNIGNLDSMRAAQSYLYEQHAQQPDQLPGPSTQRNLANEYSSNIGRLNSMRVAPSHLSERRAYHPYQLPGPSTQRNLASQYSSNIGNLDSMRAAQSYLYEQHAQQPDQVLAHNHLSERLAYHPYQLPWQSHATYLPSGSYNLPGQYSDETTRLPAVPNVKPILEITSLPGLTSCSDMVILMKPSVFLRNSALSIARIITELCDKPIPVHDHLMLEPDPSIACSGFNYCCQICLSNNFDRNYFARFVF